MEFSTRDGFAPTAEQAANVHEVILPHIFSRDGERVFADVGRGDLAK